jgi:hypothetical protein
LGRREAEDTEPEIGLQWLLNEEQWKAGGEYVPIVLNEAEEAAYVAWAAAEDAAYIESQSGNDQP